jgi:hypothetical protein
MKKLFFYLSFSVFFISISCNTEASVVGASSLEGVWSLKTASGGISGINHKYNSGHILFDFNKTSKTLTVKKATSINDTYSPIGIGTFDFSIQENGTNFILVTDDQSGGDSITINCYLSSDGTTLTISGIGADAISYELIKESEKVTVAELEAKKQEIIAYINSFTCSESLGCSFIGFGSKACGGPNEYLVFANNVDLSHLKGMVTVYNDLENLYNVQNNVISNCMYVMPPNKVGCVNEVCTIIN